MMIYIYIYIYIRTYITLHSIAIAIHYIAFILNICIYIYILIGGFNPPEKYESQIGSSSQLLGKIKNSMVPNHQPVYIYMAMDQYLFSYHF